jgi:Cu(I)/Ag(I) efflux system membrane fusion protein
MAKKIIKTILLILLGAVIGGGFVVINKGLIPSFSIQEAEKDYYYTCPMHPQIIWDQPGDCPVCGMSLVKKRKGKEDEVQEEPGLVKVSPRIIQILGVKSVPVKTRKLIKEIRTVGRIEYDERKVKVVSAWIGGRIERLFVDFTGVYVNKGDPLLSIYSPNLVSTQQEYLLALETLEKVKESHILESVESAKSLVKAAKRRLLLWGITEDQIKELEEKREVSTHITIYAPVSGTVIHKGVSEGQYVKEGSYLYKIADLSTLWMFADIYEYEFSGVKVGQKVSITTPAYPGKTFYGTVDFVDPFMDRKTRTIKVRCNIPNLDNKLKPGMYANVVLKTVVGKNVLAVPANAVIHSGKRKVVLIDKGEGRFVPKEVKLGQEVEDYYQVLSGLEKGEKVVTSANFLIDSESSLKAAVVKMMEGE